MAQRNNDQIFQLSLTEIAFTIVFILLILLGYLVFKEQTEKLAAQRALAEMGDMKQAADAMTTARDTLARAMASLGISNPDEAITKLVAAEKTHAELDHLKQQVVDLDAQLTALAELKKQIEVAAQSAQKDVTANRMLGALRFQEQVRQAAGVSALDAKGGKSEDSNDAEALKRVKHAIATTTALKAELNSQLNKELPPGKEKQTVAEVVSAAKSHGEMSKGGTNPEAVKKENVDLRGQVAFLKNRLEARGGRDYPPCWADESGKVEFLFAIDLGPDSVTIHSAWPAKREVDARALPGIDEALAGPHTYAKFVSSIQSIFNWSKRQDPQCRHYVQLKSNISDAVLSDRARLQVENYFYKVEARR